MQESTGTDLINKKVVEDFMESYVQTRRGVLSAKKKMTSMMGWTSTDDQERPAGATARKNEKKPKPTMLNMIGMCVQNRLMERNG